MKWAGYRGFMAAGLVLAMMISGPAAWAARVWVEPVKGSGVSESDRESIGELIRVSIPENGADTVAAKAEEAEWTLTPSIMKLGDSYVLSLQKKDKRGQTVHGGKMKAAALNELDTVAARLTRAVMSETAVAGTADVTNITREEETMNTRRYTATRQWVFGLGPGFGSNLRSSGGGFTFTLGYLWGLDPDFSLNLSWTANSGRKSDDSSFSDFSLGGEYYFSRGKHSPFVGARLGYGSAHINQNQCSSGGIEPGCGQDGASGWAGTLTAGYKLFRTSNVNAAILGTHTQIFDRTTLGNPALTSFQIAVYF